MQEYINAIMTAARLFPLVAIIITLPYMLFQYFRYSSIMVLRIVFIYSFVLYIMCTALLTILPIPDSTAAIKQQLPQYIPLNSIRKWFAATNFNLLDVTTWKSTIFSRPAFFIIANVVMMIPMGIYLRYYYECNFGKTLVITLGVSLILELIQLSGLFGLYPITYRMFDVDDIIMNTAGGIIGFWLAKLPMKILPSQQQLNSIAYKKGLRVSILRCFAAAMVDWLFIGGVIVSILYFCMPLRLSLLDLSRKWQLFAAGLTYIGAVLLYFIFGEWLLRGRTIGKWVTRLRSANSRDEKRPKFLQCFVKYSFLYYGYTSIPLILTLLLMIVIRKYMVDSKIFTYGFGLMAVYAFVIMVIIIRVLIRYKQLPHTALSKLNILSTFKEQKRSDDINASNPEENQN